MMDFQPQVQRGGMMNKTLVKIGRFKVTPVLLVVALIIIGGGIWGYNKVSSDYARQRRIAAMRRRIAATRRMGGGRYKRKLFGRIAV